MPNKLGKYEELDMSTIPLGAVTKDGVWLGDKGGQVT
jgi:hypothetical protein